MKVFISWSGSQSQQLGKAIKEWLPSVLQAVRPYFTPDDIEKGARWENEISKELAESQIGILCVTRENIHSDWILFEAGALSKSLEKSRVCPILFGIAEADLAGPLQGFQRTLFTKEDIHKLLTVVNNQLGDHKLPLKTLETVFEKWWPDLEQKVNSILDEASDDAEPIRSDRELLEEILDLSRRVSRLNSPRSVGPSPVIRDLILGHIRIHEQQATEQGTYQDALDLLKPMHAPLEYLSRGMDRRSEKYGELITKFSNLGYRVQGEVDPNSDEDNEPF